MLKEFKKFALRGNLLELAVAVILGLAFNAVVQSLVDDMLMTSSPRPSASRTSAT